MFEKSKPQQKRVTIYAKAYSTSQLTVSLNVQDVRKKTERFELLKNIMLIYATVKH